jgi:hypothetical protein
MCNKSLDLQLIGRQKRGIESHDCAKQGSLLQTSPFCDMQQKRFPIHDWFRALMMRTDWPPVPPSSVFPYAGDGQRKPQGQSLIGRKQGQDRGVFPGDAASPFLRLATNRKHQELIGPQKKGVGVVLNPVQYDVQ